MRQYLETPDTPASMLRHYQRQNEAKQQQRKVPGSVLLEWLACSLYR